MQAIEQQVTIERVLCLCTAPDCSVTLESFAQTS